MLSVIAESPFNKMLCTTARLDNTRRLAQCGIMGGSPGVQGHQR